MKNSKLTTTLAVIGGVTAACAVAAGVLYVLKKKNGGKTKKYVSCPSEEDVSLEELDEALDIPTMEEELEEAEAETAEEETDLPLDGE